MTTDNDVAGRRVAGRDAAGVSPASGALAAALLSGRQDMRAHLVLFAGGVLALSAAAGCATVKVEAPDEPIEINLNVNIQQEVRVKLEREIEDLIAENPDIF